MSSVDYELILEKVPNNERDLACVKSLLLVELQFSVEEALKILSEVPVAIATSSDESTLEPIAARFLAAGAEVSIKKKMLLTLDDNSKILEEVELFDDDVLNDRSDGEINIIDLPLEENLEDILAEFQEQELNKNSDALNDQNLFVLSDDDYIDQISGKMSDLLDQLQTSQYDTSDNNLSAPLELLNSDQPEQTVQERESLHFKNNDFDLIQKTTISSNFHFELEESEEINAGSDMEQSLSQSQETFTAPDKSAQGSRDEQVSPDCEASSKNDEQISGKNPETVFDNFELKNKAFETVSGNVDGSGGVLEKKSLESKDSLQTATQDNRTPDRPLLVPLLIVAVVCLGVLNILNFLSPSENHLLLEAAAPMMDVSVKNVKNQTEELQAEETQQTVSFTLISEESTATFEFRRLNLSSFLVSILLKDFPKVDLKSAVIRPELLDENWIDSLRVNGIVEGRLEGRFSIPGRVLLRNAKAISRLESQVEIEIIRNSLVVRVKGEPGIMARSFTLPSDFEEKLRIIEKTD